MKTENNWLYSARKNLSGSGREKYLIGILYPKPLYTFIQSLKLHICFESYKLLKISIFLIKTFMVTGHNYLHMVSLISWLDSGLMLKLVFSHEGGPVYNSKLTKISNRKCVLGIKLWKLITVPNHEKANIGYTNPNILLWILNTKKLKQRENCENLDLTLSITTILGKDQQFQPVTHYY